MAHIPAVLCDVVRRIMGLHFVRVVGRPIAAGFTATQQLAPSHLTLRLVNEQELLRHCAPELDLSAAHCRSAFARGDFCVAAFDGDIVAGYEWIAFGPTPHIEGVWVDFHSRARYCYKQFVRTGYRGRRIAAAISLFADAWCAQRAYESTVSFIAIENRASWHAASSIGSRTIGYAGYFSAFGLFAGFRTPGTVSTGFRFYVPLLPYSRDRHPALPRAPR